MRWLWVLVLLAFACSTASRGRPGRSFYDPEVARYRLLLRHNPIDPGAAFRCYGGCQSHTSPAEYLSCLAECPAFEATEGVACTANEIPPVAACITARRLPDPGNEGLSPGFVVLAVVANIALIVAASSACSSSPSCGAYYYYPGALPVSGPGPF